MDIYQSLILPDIKTGAVVFFVRGFYEKVFVHVRHISFNQNIMRVLPGTLPEQLKITRLITVDHGRNV